MFTSIFIKLIYPSMFININKNVIKDIILPITSPDITASLFLSFSLLIFAPVENIDLNI